MIPNKNSHWHVVNAEGTSGHRCGCQSWLAHWRRHTGSRRMTCARHGCKEPVAVGAHVQSTDRRTRDALWIVPLCRACNLHHFREEMVIDQRTSLVSADYLDTCGR